MSVEKLKALRQQIAEVFAYYELVQTEFVDEQYMLSNQDYIGSACTSLALAKGWLGEAIGTITGKPGYPVGNDTKTTAIDPQREAEKSQFTVFLSGEQDIYIMSLKERRAKINEIIFDVRELQIDAELGPEMMWAEKHLVEARMLMGMEMRRVTDFVERQSPKG